MDGSDEADRGAAVLRRTIMLPTGLTMTLGCSAPPPQEPRAGRKPPTDRDDGTNAADLPK